MVDNFWDIVMPPLCWKIDECKEIAKRPAKIMDDVGGLMEVQQFKNNPHGYRTLMVWREHYIGLDTPFVVTKLGHNISIWKERVAGGDSHWYRKHKDYRKGVESWRSQRYRPTH